MTGEEDIERIIEEILPMASYFLKEMGEFFPFAGVMTTEDKVKNMATYTGEEQPKSDAVINEFKKAFRATKARYKAISIFYDVLASNPNDDSRTDAVAVFAESLYCARAWIYFYPYKLISGRDPDFGNRWKIEVDKEIFTD